MPCPICSDVNATVTPLEGISDEKMVSCHRCGKFLASGLFLIGKPYDLSPTQIGNMSGWIQEQQLEIPVQLDEHSWSFLKSINSPSVGEKADKLLKFLARKFPLPNQSLEFAPEDRYLSSCWAANKEEANYLFHQYLVSHKGFIHLPATSGRSVVISPAGWDYLHSLQYANKDSQIGFCAMWFDHSVTPLWTDGIDPAIRKAGYESIRIDKHQHNNRIDDEIISMIRRSKFIVADFTGGRGGVYFEAGLALGLGLQVIWTIEESQLNNVHFDNRQYNFLKWTSSTINEFSDSLQYKIEATIGRGPIASDS